MNINELNRVKVVSLDEAIKKGNEQKGTFKEILDRVFDETIVPLTQNGQIVGISYDAKTNSVLEDNLALVEFSHRYSDCDVMNYVLKALYLKSINAKIDEVIENDDEIKVIYNNGLVEVIKENLNEDFKIDTSSKEGQTITFKMVDILDMDFDPDSDNGVLKYLRFYSQHYLSGKDPKPTITRNYDDDTVTITNIKWGRKI